MHRNIQVLILLLLAPMASAQETRYVSDEQYVPLRSGAGSEYRIVHRGIPSGTRVTVQQQDEASGFSQITTAGGTEGWIRTQYLMDEPAAKDKLAAAESARKKAIDQAAAASAEMKAVESQLRDARKQLSSSQQKLTSTSSELTELKRISGNAVALDQTNRALMEEVEVLKSRIELMEADNQRLKDSSDNEAFLNGALAVGLGVLIALLVPRLRPRRRASSSWA